MPPETQGEVVIDGHRCESTWYANIVRVARYGADFNDIQAAIDYANSQTPTAANPWVIEVYPGTYTGALILYQYISLIAVGNHEETHLFVSDDTLITLNGAGYQTIKGFTLTVDSPSAATLALINNDTGAEWVWIEDCKFRVTNPGAIRMRGYSATVAASNASFKNCFVDVDTLMTWIYLDQVWSAVEIDSCTSVGAYQDIQCTNGSVWLENSTLRGSGTHLYVDGGSVIFTNTRLNNIIQTAGTILCKGTQNEYHVYAGMRIQDAITAAITATPNPANTAPYTILIHPGIYDEAITMAAWVNLRGIGPKGSVVIQQTNADVLQLNSNVELQNLSLRITTPEATRSLVKDAGNAYTGVKLTDVIFEYTTPAAIANLGMLLTGGSTVIMERCTATWVAGTGAEIVVSVTTAASTVSIDGCNFSNNNGIASLINSAFAGTVITVVDSRLHGAASHLVASAGIIRVANSQYRSVARSTTGNIVDESPQLQDAPWKVHKWDWMTALANADVGVRGDPLDAGSGQILLEVNDGATEQEAVEANTEAAGALGNEFTPARTPRFITQISVDSFDPHVTMFFGLRELLGDLIPDITLEECAGFDWNGANFRAISSDGGGAGVATNIIPTPSVDVQHQLEVIVIGGVRVEFYVDGVLVATHATAAGRPSAALDWQHLLAAAAGGGGDEIDVTVRTGGCQECPA